MYLTVYLRQRGVGIEIIIWLSWISVQHSVKQEWLALILSGIYFTYGNTCIIVIG